MKPREQLRRSLLRIILVILAMLNLNIVKISWEEWKVDQNLLSNCDDQQEKGDNQIFMVKDLLLQSSFKIQPLCRMHWPVKIRINGKRQLREREMESLHANQVSSGKGKLQHCRTSE